MGAVKECLDFLFEHHMLENICIRAGRGDDILLDVSRCVDGLLDADTKFDLASVTKIFSTTTIALIALDRGLLSLDDKVDQFFSCPEDRKHLTIRHLMIHSYGVGHRNMTQKGSTYDNIQEEILQMPLDFLPGESFAYSCPAFVLLGKILEQVFGDRLDRLFRSLVAQPLGLKNTGYLPKLEGHFVNSNPTPEELGVVNDYNCRYLGGVAGNAGLFSTLNEMTVYAQFLLHHGAPLMREETFLHAIQRHLEAEKESRALGFLYVDEHYAQTDGLFPNGSIGHCGHTGQSIFIDPATDFYTIILSDATLQSFKKEGHDFYPPVMVMRQKLHEAVRKDLGLPSCR